jgi:hypothetical protein
MPKYIVPINFWGTIEADSAEDAFQKVIENTDCEAFEDALAKVGLTDIQHYHEEVEEEDE